MALDESIHFKDCVIDANGKGILILSMNNFARLNLQEIIELRNWLNKIIYLGTNEVVET